MTSSSDILVAEIDRFLEILESAQDDRELRALFDTFEEKYDLNLPSDPFSDHYRATQFALYERLAGKPYTPANEVSGFDVAEMAISPFPYHHQSSDLVGEQLMAIGYIIKVMALPPGARILEFGPGWGNTTLALAKMGYQVTAVDIEKNFVDLIRRRAEMEGLNIDARVGDFSLIDALDDQFDAVLFFECFHHAQDHIKLISAFDRVLRPDGLVCFAAEPINETFPLPWGLRMDGQSVWAIRKNGWLELGFNLKYFSEALRRNGFICTRHKGADSPLSSVLLARRKADFERVRKVLRYRHADGTLFHQCGVIKGDSLAVSPEDRGVVSFGPYAHLPSGSYELTIRFSNIDIPADSLSWDIVTNKARWFLIEPERLNVPSDGVIKQTVSLYPSGEGRGVKR
ncbi:class I SAM-dependent methyltransferase [Erythrobacter sp. WG]|uniref:class I SAM-dependent methyltransferase n=1 Tax=Erythrobacter sp. WG TaxID=2985510 RepID=UPI00226F4313|nr:class I SAM-dependent methyltransferase [Erythrobacter sp. WG]MCX9148519.1 methyltransferase domain-containing protein [Erythrobacter sp. WG]